MSLLPSEPDTSGVDETDPRVLDVNSEDADEVLSALTADTARELLSALHSEPAPPAELADRVDTSLQNAQYHLEKLEDAGAITVVDQIYSEKGREMNVYAPADQPLVIFAGDEDRSTGLRAALSRFLGSLGVIALGSVVVQELFGEGVFGLFGSGGEETGQQSAGPTGGPAAGNETATPDTTAYQSATESAEPGVEIASQPSPTAESDTVDIALDTANTTAPAPETATEATRTTTETAQAATDAAGSTAPDTAAAAMSLPPGLLFFLGGVTALAVVASVWYLTD